MEKPGNILMDKYEFGKLLGQGNFAKVYHARNIATGQSVAIKVIDKEKVLKVGLIEQTKREISVMRLVKQANVVQLYEVMATRSRVYYVMEYAKGGELFNKVARGRLKEDSARKYFQQLITALDYCHSRGVYHRDLKPENLLLDENGVLKISDFGLSALAESKHQDGLLHTTCGTPAYVAPEVISRKGYDGSKADIWSCGVVLFVLLSGYLPFHDSNLMEMYRKITRGRYRCPGWFSPEVKRLISRILDPNPKTRISIPMIMEDPWFRLGLESTVGMEEEVVEWGCCEAENKKMAARLNAFDIISLSSGFDLSGLFTEKGEGRREAKFTSRETAGVIVSKFEEIAERVGMRVVVGRGGGGGGRVVRMVEEEGEGGFKLKGNVGIDVEIFEVTTGLHLVEVRWGVGGEVIMRNQIGPCLCDIVWAWHGCGFIGAPRDALPQQQQQHQQPPPHLILPAF